jgi:hypothetical protein
MVRFIRLTLFLAAALVALFVLAFVLKLLVAAALLAALLLGGLCLFKLIRAVPSPKALNGRGRW